MANRPLPDALGVVAVPSLSAARQTHLDVLAPAVVHRRRLLGVQRATVLRMPQPVQHQGCIPDRLAVVSIANGATADLVLELLAT